MLALRAFALFLLSAVTTAHAQQGSGPPAPEAAPSAPSDATDLTPEQRIEQLTREVQAQKQAMADQRAELEARLEQIEARAQAAATQAEQAQSDAQMQAELAALMSEGDAEAALQEIHEDRLLRIYGFADMGLQRTWGPVADIVPGGSTKTTFVLGNVNLYFDSHPVEDFRFLTEIRFGLFPHGATSRSSAIAGVNPPFDNTISDDSAPNGGFTNIVWNGVLLERAHIDWMPSDQFNLRAGWFLTPYGIWNVDHGTPTRIMLEAPMIIAMEMLPSRQLGVEAFGRIQALPWTLGYHFYVSNGRQPGHLDYEDDKALGGRLYAQTRHPLPMTIGISGYTGHFESVRKTFGLRPDGNTFAREEVLLGYREYAAGSDFSMDAGHLRVRAEGVFRWKIYDEGKRDSLIPGTYNADSLTFGSYLLGAYQLPWYGLEPVLQTEVLRLALPLGEYAIRTGVGLNIYFNSAVVLRTSYMHARLFDVTGRKRELPSDTFNVLATRLIIAF